MLLRFLNRTNGRINFKHKFLLCSFFILFSVPKINAQNWPAITKESKPWTRWWWMGSAVDKNGIDQQLKYLSEAGFGGVAIVPIYGAIGFENKYLEYLSPRWMQALDITTAKAKSLNMGVDLAVGTGWPIGGPQVDTNMAATKLILQHFTIPANQIYQQKIIAKDNFGNIIVPAQLAALTAYNKNGTTIDLMPNVGKEGELIWKTEQEDWEIYAAFVGKTLQKVKRAALGGAGFVLDHFSPLSVPQYFKKFDQAFGKWNHGIRSFYNDSYEVFDADWTPDFFKLFKQRKGYALEPYLKYLSKNSIGDTAANIKADYRSVISDLMLENFAGKFSKWVYGRKLMNTNEAHGSPGNLLDIYAAADIPEAEIFGSSHFDFSGIRRDSGDIRNVDPDPIMLEFASSAAHVMGKKLISNETFTWLTEHFKTSWSQCKPEVENVFLAGINHVFFHGTTYSPTNVPWPGWLFYASTDFVPTNSLWPHLNGLTQYISRCQSVLQSGKSDNEILVYWPVYDQWNQASGLDMPFKVHNIDEWLKPTNFYNNVHSLEKLGYRLDFVSDKMLAESRIKNQLIQIAPTGAEYKVLIVPAAKYMPLETLQKILLLAKNGAKVILQKLPSKMPGMIGMLQNNESFKWKKVLSELDFKKLNDSIQEAKLGSGKIVLAEQVPGALKYLKLEREKMAANGLQFIRRKIPHGKYYYIVNHTAKAIDQDVELNVAAKQVFILNPQTGETGSAKMRMQQHHVIVHLQMLPGTAMIIQTTDLNNSQIKQYPVIQKSMQPIELKNSWTLHFSSGGPSLPLDKQMKQLQTWTSIEGDSSLKSFSGTGTYSTSFDLKDKNADNYILKLENVFESAKVFVNGKNAGLLWTVPFQIDIGKYLRVGKNELQIEVNNLMSNRIAYLDRNKIEWKKYHEINFVNIDYKPFDASNWKTQASGLSGNISITPILYKFK